MNIGLIDVDGQREGKRMIDLYPQMFKEYEEYKEMRGAKWSSYRLTAASRG